MHKASLQLSFLNLADSIQKVHQSQDLRPTQNDLSIALQTYVAHVGSLLQTKLHAWHINVEALVSPP